MIEARALTIKAGRRPLIEEVSIAVAAGEIVAVIGPNGAGKSTLLRALAGDLPAAAGEVRLGGRPLAGQAPRALARQRAVMLQGTKVVFPFAVSEVVLLGRGLEPDSAGDGALVRHVLGEVGLPEAFAERIYTTLSGGEQQRVDLARVLLQVRGATAEAPAILLLDEPTASLDLAHESQILALLRREVATGRLGVLVVLHDLTLAGWLADRLVLMSQGRVLAEGKPASVLDPAVIERAYGAPVSVIPHPGSGVALVLPARLSRKRDEDMTA